jgi:putative transposase
MPQLLCQDLRARIVRAVAEGSSAQQAAARFDVSPSTAVKLMQRYRATGGTALGPIGGYRRPLLADHEDVLRAVTSAHPGMRRPGSRPNWPSAGSRPATCRPCGTVWAGSG